VSASEATRCELRDSARRTLFDVVLTSLVD
jgi:hypothetical protein